MHAWRVTWAGLMTRVRAPRTASNDSDSYAENFDDDGWKGEEAEYWRTGSFAYRLGQPSRSSGVERVVLLSCLAFALLLPMFLEYEM